GPQDRLEIERRTHGASDFAKGRELLDRASEIAGPSFQLFEQPHVLDGDHRLVSEGLEKGNLALCERPELAASHAYHTERRALSQQGHTQLGSMFAASR